MKTGAIKNVSASVRQRLLNLSREQQRPFQEVLQFYAMERFLYRMGKSAYADSFILKGALMLQVWNAPQSRPTVDIDMLGRINNDHAGLEESVKDIIATGVEDDGLEFQPDALTLETITKDADYNGVRIRFPVLLAGARIRLQIDIGFGDAMEPDPQLLTYPVLLDFPAPELLCYTRESAIAEKFEAMVSLGDLNTRLKDFYDIWLLCRQFEFQSKALRKAVRATFDQRGTALPGFPLFSAAFIVTKQTQWLAFAGKLGLEGAQLEFSNITALLETFLGETVESSETSRNIIWPPGGSWLKAKDSA